MKKIIALIVTLCLVICCLPSCISGGNDSGYKIAVVPKLTSSTWFERMEEGVKDYNEEHGTNYFYGGPTDPTSQVTYLEQLLAEDWDAICIVPYDTESIAPLLEKARKEGILIITHEADTLDEKYFDYDIEAFRSEDLGTYYGERIVEKTGGEGTYIQFVGSLNSISHNIWCDSADAYISANSNLKKLGRYETNENMTSAYNQTKELLQAHPEINAIETSSSTDIAGVAKAVSELGLAGKVTIVGTSLPSSCGEYVNSGVVEEFSLWDPAMSAKAMLELAENVLETGETFDINSFTSSLEGYEKNTIVNNVIYGNARVDITKANMENYNF